MWFVGATFLFLASATIEERLPLPEERRRAGSWRSEKGFCEPEQSYCWTHNSNPSYDDCEKLTEQIGGIGFVYGKFRSPAQLSTYPCPKGQYCHGTCKVLRSSPARRGSCPKIDGIHWFASRYYLGGARPAITGGDKSSNRYTCYWRKPSPTRKPTPPPSPKPVAPPTPPPTLSPAERAQMERLEKERQRFIKEENDRMRAEQARVEAYVREMQRRQQAEMERLRKMFSRGPTASQIVNMRGPSLRGRRREEDAEADAESDDEPIDDGPDFIGDAVLQTETITDEYIEIVTDSELQIENVNDEEHI